MKQAIRQKKSTRGDTIVEVLIAMTVIAAVLGGAYSIASRSSKSGIEARERVQTLKLVEGQVENLKSQRYADPADFALDRFHHVDFCFNSSLVSASNPSGYVANAAPGVPECDSGGVPFHLNIHYNSADNYYVFTAVWDSLKEGQNNVEIRFRP